MTYKIEGLQSNHNLKLVDPLNPLHFGSWHKMHLDWSHSFVYFKDCLIYKALKSCKFEAGLGKSV